MATTIFSPQETRISWTNPNNSKLKKVLQNIIVRIKPKVLKILSSGKVTNLKNFLQPSFANNLPL